MSDQPSLESVSTTDHLSSTHRIPVSSTMPMPTPPQPQEEEICEPASTTSSTDSLTRSSKTKSGFRKPKRSRIRVHVRKEGITMAEKSSSGIDVTDQQELPKKLLNTGTRCMAGGCSNTASHGFTVHNMLGKMPADGERFTPIQKAWIDFIARTRKFDTKYAMLYKHITLCNGHFREEDYVRTQVQVFKYGHRRKPPLLKKDAVPSITVAKHPFPPEWFILTDKSNQPSSSPGGTSLDPTSSSSTNVPSPALQVSPTSPQHRQQGAVKCMCKKRPSIPRECKLSATNGRSGKLKAHLKFKKAAKKSSAGKSSRVSTVKEPRVDEWPPSRGCFVYGCNLEWTDGVVMHLLPLTAVENCRQFTPRQKLWIDFIGSSKKFGVCDAKKYSRLMVCSAHFREEDYDFTHVEMFKRGLRSIYPKLKKDAVPSVIKGKQPFYKGILSEHSFSPHDKPSMSASGRSTLNGSDVGGAAQSSHSHPSDRASAVMTLEESSVGEGSILDGDDRQLEGRLHCICRSTDCSEFMIMCHFCEILYHGRCIGINKAAAKFLKTYACLSCRAKHPNRYIIFEDVEQPQRNTSVPDFETRPPHDISHAEKITLSIAEQLSQETPVAQPENHRESPQSKKTAQSVGDQPTQKISAGSIAESPTQNIPLAEHENLGESSQSKMTSQSFCDRPTQKEPSDSIAEKPKENTPLAKPNNHRESAKNYVTWQSAGDQPTQKLPADSIAEQPTQKTPLAHTENSEESLQSEMTSQSASDQAAPKLHAKQPEKADESSQCETTLKLGQSASENSTPKMIKQRLLLKDCGKCDACSRHEDCGSCTACHDKETCQDPTKRTEKCLQRCCQHKSWHVQAQKDWEPAYRPRLKWWHKNLQKGRHKPGKNPGQIQGHSTEQNQRQSTGLIPGQTPGNVTEQNQRQSTGLIPGQTPGNVTEQNQRQSTGLTFGQTPGQNPTNQPGHHSQNALMIAPVQIHLQTLPQPQRQILMINPRQNQQDIPPETPGEVSQPELSPKQTPRQSMKQDALLILWGAPDNPQWQVLGQTPNMVQHTVQQPQQNTEQLPGHNPNQTQRQIPGQSPTEREGQVLGQAHGQTHGETPVVSEGRIPEVNHRQEMRQNQKEATQVTSVQIAHQVLEMAEGSEGNAETSNMTPLASGTLTFPVKKVDYHYSGNAGENDSGNVKIPTTNSAVEHDCALEKEVKLDMSLDKSKGKGIREKRHNMKRKILLLDSYPVEEQCEGAPNIVMKKQKIEEKKEKKEKKKKRAIHETEEGQINVQIDVQKLSPFCLVKMSPPRLSKKKRKAHKVIQISQKVDHDKIDTQYVQEVRKEQSRERLKEKLNQFIEREVEHTLEKLKSKQKKKRKKKKKKKKKKMVETSEIKTKNCGQCAPCKVAEDCGQCEHCLVMYPVDKYKGSDLKLRRRCVRRTCVKFTQQRTNECNHEERMAQLKAKCEAEKLEERREKREWYKRCQAARRALRKKKKEREAMRLSVSTTKQEWAGPTKERLAVDINMRSSCRNPGCVRRARGGSRCCSDQCAVRVTASYAIKRMQSMNVRNLTADDRRDVAFIARRIKELDGKLDKLPKVIQRAKTALFKVEEEYINMDDSAEETNAPAGQLVRAATMAIAHVNDCHKQLENREQVGENVRESDLAGYINDLEGTHNGSITVLDPPTPEKEPPAFRLPWQKKQHRLEACRCPLVANIFEKTRRFCRRPKDKCRRHQDWERLCRVELELEKFKWYLRLDDHLEKAFKSRIALQESNKAPLNESVIEEGLPSPTDGCTMQDRTPTSREGILEKEPCTRDQTGIIKLRLLPVDIVEEATKQEPCFQSDGSENRPWMEELQPRFGTSNHYFMVKQEPPSSQTLGSSIET